jgi:hypothetical protein
VYTYPNGAKRNITLTATQNQQYTPTASEVANAASAVYPVYDVKYAASGIEDSTPSIDAKIGMSYFVPTTSIPKSSIAKSQSMPVSAKTAKLIAQMRGSGASSGFQMNWAESGSKGADVAIGSLLDYYESIGRSVKTTGSVYAVASALSDMGTAKTIGQQVEAWVAELAALEKCAADPTNPITQTDPTYTANTVANLQAIRAQLKEIGAVRILNVMDETALGHPVTAVLTIPLKQAFVWNEQTLKDVSEKLMQDARASVVSCKPNCPTNFAANGVSDSQIDLTWDGSIGNKVVTGYDIFGGNATGASTTSTMYSDTGLPKSKTYCYTVLAYNDYGTAENCPQACGTTFGPPVVEVTNPYNTETNVSVKTAVSASFSEVVDTATVNNSTFFLSSSGGAVGGAISYSGKTATFTPSADLSYSTKYTATVTTGVKDLDGVAMEADYIWSFTTEAAPAAGNVQFSIANSNISVSGSASVTWTLVENLGDVHRYVPTGTITGDIAISDCDPMHTTAPLQATVLHSPGPTMVVYTATNVAFPNSYQFALAADPKTILTFTCGTEPNRYTLPLAASSVLNFMVGICTAIDLIPFTNEAALAGTYSCGASGLVSATWDFSK